MSTFLSDPFTSASTEYVDATSAPTGGAWAAYTQHSGWTSTAQIIGGAGYIQWGANLATYRSTATPGDAFGTYSIVCKVDGGSDGIAAIFGRASSAADTMYLAMVRENFGSNDIRLERFNAGTYDAGNSTGKSFTAWTTDRTLGLKFEDLGGGSHKISLLVDGVEELSVTDTSPIAGPGFAVVGGRNAKTSSVVAADETISDTTAPTLTSPTGTGSTLTSAGGVATDEGNGTLYMVTTASATAPTKAQVKAGQDHAGAAALRVSSVAVSSTGAKTFSAASCTAGTRYNHYMHEDAAANQSNVVSSASFVVGSGVTFSGTVPAQSGVTGDSFSLDLSTYFSGNMTRTYAVQSGSLTSSGLSLNTSSGIVSGTLGTVGAYSISVRATDTYSDTDDTNSFTITISSTGTAPTVSTHPTSTTVTAGNTASFTAAASGSPTPTVQWQENTGSWSNISGQTTTTLSLGVVGTPDNGRQFRAVFTNSSGSATTNTATLTVNAAAGDGTITSEPLKNNMGQLLGAATLSWVGFRNASTGADVLLLTSVAVNSSSIFTTGTNAALAPGQLYAINWKTSDGKYGYAWANAV